MDWRPQPKQETFLRMAYDEAMFGGAKGPGKTDALLFDATYQVKRSNYKAIIFRRTFPNLLELIDRSHKWFKDKAHWNGELKRWTWPTGASLKFGHCKNEEDKYNYQGHEYQYMGFDQLEEFTEGQYRFLMAQNRSSDPNVKCFIRCTSNPGNVGHAWVKQRFIDQLKPDGTPKHFIRKGDEEIEVSKGTPGSLSRAFLFATIHDNQILLNSDPGYMARLDQLPEKLRRALKEGDWDAYEGQYFAEWRRNIHVVDSFNKSKIHNIVIGLDYGFAKPASVGWYALLPDGDIVRYREFYKEGYSYESLAKEILKLSKGEEIEYMVSDPAIWGDKAHHKPTGDSGEVKGESGAETMQNVIGKRFPIIKGDNKRVIGWGRFREYLKAFRNAHNEVSAKFRVTQDCPNFIRTIPGLIHDDKNSEDLNTNGEDHPQDEARYVFMSRPALPAMKEEPQTPSEDFWVRVKKDIKNSKSVENETADISEEGAREIEEPV